MKIEVTEYQKDLLAKVLLPYLVDLEVELDQILFQEGKEERVEKLKQEVEQGNILYKILDSPSSNISDDPTRKGTPAYKKAEEEGRYGNKEK